MAEDWIRVRDPDTKHAYTVQSHDARHTLTLEFELSWGPSYTWKCDGDDMSPCWQVCPLPECEEGCTDPTEHPQESIGECNVVLWFENGDDVETWVSGGRTSVTVPIEYQWSSNGPEWRFA